MKKRNLRILVAALLVASTALPLLACQSDMPPVNSDPDTTVEQTTEASDTTPDETDAKETEPATEAVTDAVTDAVTEPVTEEETEPETEPSAPLTPPVAPEAFGETSGTYECEDGSILFTYADQTNEDFARVCAHYVGEGYTLYNSSDMGGNLSSTYVKDSAMAHVYWHPSNGELNLVLSHTAGGTLPPSTPAVTDGTYACTVTQMMDAGHVNGMSYVIQLKDGSYIIYDGGYSNLTVTLESFLLDNYHGEGKPIIRAWVLTHSHNDHYPAFQMLVKRAKRNDKFVIENIIISPMNEAHYDMPSVDNYDPYLSTQFYKDVKHLTNTNIIFAHTGMRFTFCNLDMEILYTPESYYKTTLDLGNFNNTSIVSRLTGESYSALFTGDVGIQGSTIMENLYGNYLKSDMCQISHHGVEDVPLSFYEYVEASILFYPCDLWLYDQTDRHWEERQAMEDWACTKEILIAGLNRYTRPWGTTFDPNAPLSMPDYTPPVVDEEDETDSSSATKSMTIDKTTYAVGESIIVTATGTGTDWVGIAPKGASGSHRWWYVTAVGSGTPFDLLSTVDGKGDSGTLPAGSYEIRLIANDASWSTGTILASIDITITE